MLGARQTLRHKETNELVRLHPEGPDTEMWHWGPINSGEAAFIGEDGQLLKGTLKDYTHIEDELGRPCCGNPLEGEHVATRYKKYLVPEAEMEKLREVRLLGWEAKVLQEVGENKEIRAPFCAGGRPSQVFRKWFLERRKAITLHKTYDDISAKHRDCDFPDCRHFLFVYQGKAWLYESHQGTLARTDPGQLRKVAALVQSLPEES